MYSLLVLKVGFEPTRKSVGFEPTASAIPPLKHSTPFLTATSEQAATQPSLDQKGNGLLYNIFLVGFYNKFSFFVRPA